MRADYSQCAQRGIERTQLVHCPRPSASAQVCRSRKMRDFVRIVVRRRPPVFACIGVTIGVSIASGQRPHVSAAVQEDEIPFTRSTAVHRCV